MDGDARRALAACELESALTDIGVHVLAEWFPGAEFEISRMQSGFSGAALLRLDVRNAADAGVYVLKLSSGDGAPSREELGEKSAAVVDGGFADAHIPPVLKAWHGQTGQKSSGSALLIEIAGGSLRHYTTGGSRDSTPLLTCAPNIVDGILRAWSDSTLVVTRSPSELADHVLGETREEAFGIATQFFSDREGVLHSDGRSYLSPTRVLGLEKGLPLMQAFEHGDLHAGNVLVPVNPIESPDDFWLIDFDHARREGFVGLDLAYLELGVLCNLFADLDWSVLSRCLEQVEGTNRVTTPDGMMWLVGFMTETRRKFDAFAESSRGRRDDLERQMLLARMSEALRWARRFRDQRRQSLALIYAGWYALRYESLYPGDGEDRETKVPDNGFPRPMSTVKPAPEEEALWEAVWDGVGHFAGAATYVLVAERMNVEAGVGALGKLPWSAIIDLDPRTDDDGLYSQAGMVLSGGRSVHAQSADPPLVSDLDRGTIWLFSGGSELRREPHLQFRDWYRKRFRYVRQTLEAIRRRAGDRPVVLIALPGQRSEEDAERDEDRIVRVAEAFDEVFGEGGTVHVIGESDLPMSLQHSFYPLRTATFLGQLVATFGSEEQGGECLVPARTGGSVVIHQDTLRVLQEHLEILHDRIEFGTPSQDGVNDAFWRGGQLRWRDLADELDVQRGVGPELESALGEALAQDRTRTVVLEHRPGSGGTTAALRAAWNLRHRYPVAVMRSGKAPSIELLELYADRLQRLGTISDGPVLFVAESGDLPEAYREVLYRELAARGARVTLLYVRRSLSPGNSALSVTDPLEESEAELFHARYRQLTSDPHRLSELGLLRTESYRDYRTPFFYGLITFQREFTKIGDFVDHHLREVAGRARAVLSHLALVSRYTNSGVQPALMEHLFRLKATPQELDAEDLLGPASALVVRRGGRYRIAHQLLAERILTRLAEPSVDWKLHLDDLALELIDDLCTYGDPSSDPVRLLLRQLFIDRVSGFTDGVEDRGDFAPIIEEIDKINPSIGHSVLRRLTEEIPDEPHFWNHLGRHQIYRLNRDLDRAEEYLEKAIDLSPGDSIHYHTLGLARRGRLIQGLETAEGQGVEAVKDVIDAWFTRTVDCFEEARSLSPDDIYGYITHVQVITRASRAIRDAGKVQNVAELEASDDGWVTDQMTTANTLLEEATNLYGSLDRQDDYLKQCRADILRLYGNLDAAVRVWERKTAGGQSTPYSRRALAQAYLIRADRSWRSLTDGERERIVELAEENLRGAPREEDYRFWFESSRLQGGFDIEQALNRLDQWSARFPSWRASYYRYILHFLLWFDERTDDTAELDAAQEECLRLNPARPKHSHVWLSSNPSWCPLVADSDLGTWDRRKGFWRETELLQRVNGVIDVINGPARGSISVGDDRMQAFFAPGHNEFSVSADENTPVNFFLGFSPSGLRAWDVQRGHLDDALTRRGEIADLPALVGRPRESGFERRQKERAKVLKANQLRDISRALLEARASGRGSVPLGWLEGRVAAMLGLEALDKDRLESIRRAVVTHPDFRISGDAEEPMIERRSAAATADRVEKAPSGELLGFIARFDRPDRWGLITAAGVTYRFSFDDVINQEALPHIRRNLVVRFLVSSETRGERAVRVELLSDRATLMGRRLVEDGQLSEMVASEVRSRLEAALAEDRTPISAAEIEDHLERTFRGGVPLGVRLKETGLRAYLRRLPGVTVGGKAGSQTISLQADAVFGQSRENLSRAPINSPGDSERHRTPQGAEASASEPATILDELLAECERDGTAASLQRLGPRLKQRLGPDRYAAFVGKGGLKEAISKLGPWTLTLDRPDLWIVRRAGSGTTEEFKSEFSAEEIIAQGLTKLREANREETLAELGPVLSKLLGPESYSSFIRGSLRRRIEETDRWQVVERSPKVFVIVDARVQ